MTERDLEDWDRAWYEEEVVGNWGGRMIRPDGKRLMPNDDEIEILASAF